MGSPRSPDGRLVAGYRLEERLGRGGGGEVYRAAHPGTGAPVALKLLRDPRSLPLVERARSVRHPGLVAILATGVDPSEGAFVVMELLRGTTLRDVLARRGRLGREDALAVVLPVLDALEAAHAAGLVHGDLKPDNVLLERLDGGGARVRVLDLGGLPQAAGAGPITGSAAYLSPEHAAGEPLDARSDVFGAGLLLFELLAGRPPFEASTPVAAAYATVHHPAPPVGDARVQPVLDVALAKAPGERFPGAAAFRAALAGLAPAVDDETVSAAALSALAGP
jgi:eukaryotic-like serine/threonine-protein kinase